MPFLVNGMILSLKVDSGADVNVISMANYLKVTKGDTPIAPPSKVNHLKLLDFGGNEIRCAGEITTTIAACKEGPKLAETFYVATSRPQSLLSYATATRLGVLVMNRTILQAEIAEIFPSMPIEPVRLKIDESVEPRVCIYNSIPAALEEFVNNYWDTQERKGIIEPMMEAPRWLSRVDVVPKKDGTFRVIIDMRPANKAISRMYYPMPNPDHLITTIVDAMKFAKLDFHGAYHHVMLHVASRCITAFMTSKGARQFTRLPFGINCAPEIYQKIMNDTFGSLEGVIVYLDDLLVYAPDSETLQKRLQAVMEVVKTNNLTLNLEKCIMEADEVEFLGSILSATGCKPVPGRIDGITEFPVPQTYGQLREFIGLVNYISKHLYDISTTMEPMRRLLEGNSRELRGAKTLEGWGTAQDEAFQATKEKVANHILEKGFFNALHPTKITTDASPVGLAAMVTQLNPKTWDERVIACSSRSLTKTERKHPQTQREAMGIAWGIPHFRYFLLGTEFTLVTDHEPMKFIFGDGARTLNKRAINRAENYSMLLSPYKFNVEIIKSNQNKADCLSRCPAPNLREDWEDEKYDYATTAMVGAITTEEMINRNAGLTSAELRETTAVDPQLLKVMYALKNGDNWEAVPEFSRFKSELQHVDGILWRENRAIVPGKLQAKAMGIAHRSHPGMSTTKHLLRKFVWWPAMDRHVEEFIKSCATCIKLSTRSPPEPLVMSNFPEKPWQDLAIDFWSGSEHDKKVLVIADYYSKAIRAEILKETTSEATIKALEKVFNDWGWPLSVKHDNGPQLVSKEFKRWLQANDIQTLPTTPRDAQENGLVERHMKGVTRAFAIAKLEKLNPEETLRQYVSDYNSWPHSVTQLSPRDVLMGRLVKSRLPQQKTGTESKSRNPNFCKAFYDEGRERDQKFKSSKKEKEDKKRRAVPSELKVGDMVYILNHDRQSKTDPNFLSTKHEITSRSGGRLTLKSLIDGSKKIRKTSCVKLVPLNEHDGSGMSSLEEQNSSSGDAISSKPTSTPDRQLTEQATKSADERSKRIPQPKRKFALVEQLKVQSMSE